VHMLVFSKLGFPQPCMLLFYTSCKGKRVYYFSQYESVCVIAVSLRKFKYLLRGSGCLCGQQFWCRANVGVPFFGAEIPKSLLD